jgi:hypothetical protein
MIAHSCPCFRIARLHLLVCDKCHCTPHGPVHQLRGRLPATKSLCTVEHVSKSALLTPAKGLLWLQPVKQAIFKLSTGVCIKPKTAMDRGCFLFPQELQELPKPAGHAKSFGPAGSIAL